MTSMYVCVYVCMYMYMYHCHTLMEWPLCGCVGSCNGEYKPGCGGVVWYTLLHKEFLCHHYIRLIGVVVSLLDKFVGSLPMNLSRM